MEAKFGSERDVQVVKAVEEPATTAGEEKAAKATLFLFLLVSL